LFFWRIYMDFVAPSICSCDNYSHTFCFHQTIAIHMDSLEVLKDWYCLRSLMCRCSWWTKFPRFSEFWRGDGKTVS
jgi:hypothetical protein